MGRWDGCRDLRLCLGFIDVVAQWFNFLGWWGRWDRWDGNGRWDSWWVGWQMSFGRGGPVV
jgi:hypothetical protein